MAVEASDEPNLLCDSDFGDDGRPTLKRHTTYEKNQLHSEVRKLDFTEESDDFDGDVPVQNSSMGTSGSNFDDSVQKTPTTLSVKRPLDNSKTSHTLVIKSKFSSYDDDGDDDEDDDDDAFSSIVKNTAVLADQSLSMLKKFMDKELDLVEKSFEECQRRRQVEEQRLHSLEGDIEDCTKELENKRKQVSCIKKINEVYKRLQTKIEECVCDFVTKETLHNLMEELVRERELQLKTKEVEIHQVMHNMNKEREGKEEELEVLNQKIAQCTEELKTKEEELDAAKKLIDGQEKELESIKKKLLTEISTSTGHAQMKKDFESMKKQLEGQMKELESIEKQLDGREKEINLKEEEFVEQVKDVESKQMHFESLMEELKSKEKQLEVQVDELEVKEKQLKDQIKEFESKEEEFVQQVEDVESNKKHFESLMEKLKLKEEELELKEKQLKGQVNEVESKKGEFAEQVKDLESKKNHCESLMEELKSKENLLEGRLKELDSKEKQLEVRVKELELKMEEFESHAKEFKSDERREMQNDESVKSFEDENELDKQLSPYIDGRSVQLLCEETDAPMEELKYLLAKYASTSSTDKQSSPSTDGRSLQLLQSEKTDEATSDPSKVVLDTVQKLFIPLCMKGDNAVIIDSSHIAILEQLMRSSPHVKPHVREEAMRLALDLKVNMRPNTENSLVVLCFLLILSIYGLLSCFGEDEVLKLFEFVAHHKQAVELFRTLGFADRVSDFVQNLIKKQKHIEAVRFICAFKLADKNQPVDLLREYVQNAELISKSSCKNTDSLEIKDKARDQEIESLKSVQKCISDNNLESKDLLNEIEGRILRLNRQKGSSVYQKCCTECKTTQTPKWRGPAGLKNLCNACGLRYKGQKRKREQRR